VILQIKSYNKKEHHYRTLTTGKMRQQFFSSSLIFMKLPGSHKKSLNKFFLQSNDYILQINFRK